jgi:hypothetical protein
MLRVGSWLYGRKSSANSPTPSLTSLLESQDLVEDAMAAASLILNDDVDGAEEGLSQGTSSFHKLGKGVVGFIRATLGFEQDIIREASERLYEAETGSSYDLQKAQYHSNAPNELHSQIYSPGTEYALCQAMAQIMAAVVGVLNESLTESIKGFYKLRKAFITLDGIVQMEEKYLQTYHAKLASSSESSLTPNPQPGLVSFPTGLDGTTTMPSSPGSSRSPRQDQDLTEKLSELNEKPSSVPPVTPPTPTLATILGQQDPDSTNTMDIFIHSGSNLCFGMLLLIISMVPPAFSKLLYVIGFRGDKERGLKMLWQASKFQNMMGAIAAISLLGYYNGFVRYCDIIPDSTTTDEEEDVVGYPAVRLMTLLAEMRARYPKSQLWLIEESRMKSAHRNLDAALELLSNGTKSPLKQVEALRAFETSLNAMYLHRYELCSQSFIECVDLNSWSRSFYYYVAGSAQLALYRQHAQSDPAAAAEHGKKAAEYFRKAPTQAGKKRFMARQLPFDVFVTRKVTKWESRAKEWKVDLVDAVGVDPLEEMIFFWNGHNRMTAEQLQESLRRLAWSESEANEFWDREGRDEKAILFVLRATILRFLRKHREAKDILETQILSYDKASFKGHLMDEWTCPAAHFEMAANLWMERPTYVTTYSHGLTDSGANNDGTISGGRTSLDRDPVGSEREMVRECKEYVDKVAKWETYVLDTRIGLKVTAAEEAIQRWEAAHPATEIY